MEAAIETLSVRIDATPYRTALTEMGELIRKSTVARRIWRDLDRRRLDGRCVFSEQVRDGGAVLLRPSADFVLALEQMRRAVEAG